MQMPNNDKAYANTHGYLNPVSERRAFVWVESPRHSLQITRKYL